MKKFIFAIICLCILISLSTASATVLLDKTGSELGSGYVEKGAEDNYFNFTTDKIQGWFHRESTWNALYYPFSNLLDSSDDFFGNVTFTTPKDWSNINSKNPFCTFGFLNNTTANGFGTDNLLFYIYAAGIGYRSINTEIVTSGGTVYQYGEYQHMLNADTKYMLSFSFDSASDNLTLKLYEGITLNTTHVVHMGAGDFKVDSFGFFTLANVEAGMLVNPFNITAVHVNTGATYEAPTGGSSVPEFSDIGWILATVLGMGGFILIRKRKF